MLRAFVLSLLFVSTSFLAADEKSDKVLKDLQGDWEVTKVVSGGKESPAKAGQKLIFTIKDNAIIPNIAKDDPATIKLNAEKKPGWFDITDKSKKTNLGIFEHSGDTLKICFVEKGERPTEFVSTKENDATIFFLKRVKK